jgi:hypothetical protein
MIDGTEARSRARRQERVAKVVWGTLFLGMGVLFTLHDMGRIDLGESDAPLTASRAVDGDDTTRWSSAFHDRQWLAVDLGADTPLGKVRIHWEDAYAKDYEVQVSSSGLQWTTVRHVTDGKGGIEEQEIGTTARYVRLMANHRSTPYGFSVWELKVFDSAGALVSQGKRATASSVEDHGPFALWARFWPLLLAASGLPLLVAPRDDTNQVIGLVLTSAGTLMQLQSLGLLPWGIRQTAAAVLVVVGLVILIQSQRRGEKPDPSGPGAAGSAS